MSWIDGPDAFAWGVASASTEIEGAAEASDWASWERAGRLPPSGSGNDFATEYRTDLALLAARGVTDIRLTFEWARIEPRNGDVDDAAIEQYVHVAAAAHQAGLRVWAGLVERTLPGWFSLDERGFREERSRTYLWPRHVDRMGEHFAEHVDAWVPIADPVVTAATGYLGGSAPPGRSDLDQFRQTLLGTHLAMLEAWRILRGSRPVATCTDLRPVHPTPSDDPEARRSASVVDRTWWGWLTDYRDGEIAIPGLPPLHPPGLVDAYDLIGFTYRGALAVDANGAFGPHPGDGDVGPLGDVAWAEGLALTLRRLAEDGPDRPLVLLGHTVASGDPDRDHALVAEALDEVESARSDGIDLRGYFHAPGIAGYDWHHASTTVHGMFDRSRGPLPVAELISERIAADRLRAAEQESDEPA